MTRLANSLVRLRSSSCTSRFQQRRHGIAWRIGYSCMIISIVPSFSSETTLTTCRQFYGVTPADSYTGSVFVITGKEDAIVCNEPLGADCGEGNTSKPATAGKFFPSAKDYSFYIPDKTGHSANLHYSAQESFKKVHDYLASQGY